MKRSDFGPNTWLVEQMYRRYQENPSSVSEAWQEFFEDYVPETDGQRRPATPREEAPPEPEPKEEVPEEAVPLRGAAKIIAENMDRSLGVPTATSFRTVPAKLLEVNRGMLNRHLGRNRGGKVSFTHLIGFAVVRALAERPAMNVAYREIDGTPHAIRNPHVHLGLAVDVQKEDGSRTLLVPNIKEAETLEFDAFWRSYEEMVEKVQRNELRPDDFAGTTVSITNPGMLGTVQSVPRLMPGQAAIIGVGAIGHPAEYSGADPDTLAELGVGKVLTLTSTYDHRVIQGAESGEFLRDVERLLLGGEDFYDRVFTSMGVPYVPVEWRRDVNPRPGTLGADEKEARVSQLINMYRVRGHLIANLDPLESEPPAMHPELDPAFFGFTIWDLDRRFPTGGLAGTEEMSLGEILTVLRDAYCRTSTVEYMHMQDVEPKRWIQERMEGPQADLTKEDRTYILSKLNQAEAFEQFLHTKYVGHRRYGLEGAESMIPMLDAILDLAADSAIEETLIGMAHRGRLNVLANVIGKSYAQIFRQFEGDIDPLSSQGSGDVKYHVGAAGKHTSRAGNQLVVSVVSNPSHLEAVDPVLQGMARAKLEQLGRDDEDPVLPLLIHGDAAFAGQGVVAETFALSQLQGYSTGGTVHIIVNNQLGFTTGSDYGRSSTYATDVAKMVQAPIFHVNGDDPEACVRVARLAFAFRETFHRDVVIDMWCYRRWGHNEGDEPAFTQPLMYEKIRSLRSVRKRYMEQLVNRGLLTVEEAERSLEEYRETLQQALDETKAEPQPQRPSAREAREAEPAPPIETGVDRAVLDEVIEGIATVPETFHVHEKLQRWLDQRRKALPEDAVDWSLAEALAFGSLIRDGVWVRLSGQDTRRGTFSQRHSVLVDQETGQEYLPLANLEGAPGRFVALDSLLSELAALGFEYGYSVSNPGALVLWEAQFGDFANGAQVVIDQFIASAEDKWGQTSGLVMLLPHGFEGQGPEHSSARLERYLTLAAKDNMEVAVPSTPAQYFHLLRRQALRDRRKPLIVLTPKSPLRLPAARSPADEFTQGRFREVLPDPSGPSEARRVLLCQGKFFYDLLRGREEREVDDVALVRVEQVYPFPAAALREQLDRYPGAEVVWAQEEPENMGAARFVHLKMERVLDVRPRLVARPESPSPATGSQTVHQQEQAELIDRAIS
ncbi:MAG TPA: multifunctional oxoglutarate decarboxylase/oxoglutarate dehydrogenase thiamine pyrophosphate-binding subunit/dihydrolipoyllysine-residue succinyltransferase subunit [Actinomycetota bacterium]